MNEDPYPATDKVGAAAWLSIVVGVFALFLVFAFLV
jgi:hypothetical protein